MSGAATVTKKAKQPAGTERPMGLAAVSPETLATLAEMRDATPSNSDLRSIEIAAITPSANVRRTFEAKPQADLEHSVRKNGVLQPILVRPLDDGFQLVAGARRLAAAKAVGLKEVPANVRLMNDDEVIEYQLVENVQRADLHPLEEAEGYHALMKRGYDAARIAAKIGRSVAYIYDRLKLMDLGQRARELFLEGVLTAGHAILLARLSEKNQKIALESRDVLGEENLLLDELEAAKQRGKRTKACSVRELQGWIDRHVRFDATAVDPMLFPDTALEVGKAVEAKRKVVAITFERYILPEARGGKTYGPASWKRADGEEKSKTCEYSKLGYVAAGRRRGESFEVCVAKERCEVHWGAQIRARKRREAARGQDAPATSSAKKERPEAAAAKLERERAITEANYKAQGEVLRRVCGAAEKLSPMAFLKISAQFADTWSMCKYLELTGLKLYGDPAVRKWLKTAKPGQIQAAIASTFFETASDSEVAEEFGISADAIFKECEQTALAELKAKKAPAKKAAKKKRGAK